MSKDNIIHAAMVIVSCVGFTWAMLEIFVLEKERIMSSKTLTCGYSEGQEVVTQFSRGKDYITNMQTGTTFHWKNCSEY